MTAGNAGTASPARLQITGDVTINNPEAIQKWIARLPNTGAVEVDLGKIGEADSLCMALLVNMKRSCQVNGVAVRFSSFPDKLLPMLDLYGVADILEIALPASDSSSPEPAAG